MSASFFANKTGTAFPICLYILPRLPINSKSLGKLCIIAASLTEILLFLLGCISVPETVIVSLGESSCYSKRLFVEISFNSNSVTCLSNLLSKRNNFLPHQSSGFGILPLLLSFLNQ